MPATLTHKEGIADMLLQEGLIDEAQYAHAVDEYERTRRSIVRILVEMGVLPDRKRMEILSRTLSTKVVSLRDVAPRPEVAGFVTREVCRRRMIVPLRIEDNTVVVAMEDPSDMRCLADLEKVFARPMRALLAADSEILEAIDRLPAEAARPDLSDSANPQDKPGYNLVATLSLMTMVFGPLAALFYFIGFTDTGKEFYGGLNLSGFENGLVFVIVAGSWASIAYFINDLIFGKETT